MSNTTEGLRNSVEVIKGVLLSRSMKRSRCEAQLK